MIPRRKAKTQMTKIAPVTVVTDSPLLRVIDPALTQVTVPITAEIGPQPPPTDTAAESETPAPEKEAKKGKHESSVRH